MAMKSADASSLDHIQDGQLHDSALNQFCNSFSIGPVKINYCLDVSKMEITFEIYLGGVRVGGGTIDRNNPSITIGGSVAGFKAEATLNADFDKRQADYNVTVCAPVVGCKNYSGILFSW